MTHKTNDQFKYQLGLIGRPLGHSFSKKYFSEKFAAEKLTDYVYDNFPLGCIHFLNILRRDNPNILGLNVTIPYKESVFPFLDEIDDTAKAIGAVNTIKCVAGKYIGYNTDADAFQQSLEVFKSENDITISGALVLGSGGASKAIRYVLKKLDIPIKVVSRDSERGDLTYGQIGKDEMAKYNLIINTTPLGAFPRIDTCPIIPYDQLTSKNALYDLVYNPGKTLFLEKGRSQGCPITNGLKMLEIQAELAWDIWTKN